MSMSLAEAARLKALEERAATAETRLTALERRLADLEAAKPEKPKK